MSLERYQSKNELKRTETENESSSVIPFVATHACTERMMANTPTTRRNKKASTSSNSSNQRTSFLPHSGGNGSQRGTETSTTDGRTKSERLVAVEKPPCGATQENLKIITGEFAMYGPGHVPPRTVLKSVPVPTKSW